MQGADGESGLGEFVVRRGSGDGPSHAEVRYQRVAFRKQHVLGFDVAMDHSMAMRVVEGVSELAGDAEGVVDGELLFTRQALPERLAFDVGHDVVELPVGPSRVEQGQDMWMRELGGDGDLAEEALRGERRGHVGAQHLEGDGAVMLQILREPDGRHASAADLALEDVATAQRRAETLQFIGHRDSICPMPAPGQPRFVRESS